MSKNIWLILMVTILFFQGCAEKSKIVYINKDSIKDVNRSDSLYEINRKQELAKLIKEPIIPLKTPDKILRVLMLPYVDKNNLLQTSNYLFVKVEDGKWIIGDYLNNNVETTNKVLTPLK